MENMTVVETSGLTKRYGNGVLAVDFVEMSVRRGELYGFLGPNGAGKTTTLLMLLGLIRLPRIWQQCDDRSPEVGWGRR